MGSSGVQQTAQLGQEVRLLDAAPADEQPDQRGDHVGRAHLLDGRLLHRAVDEIPDAGWAAGIAFDIVEGPNEYLFGEETALLEVIDGRYPFPRLAPPYRRGVDEVVETPTDVDDETSSAAHVGDNATARQKGRAALGQRQEPFDDRHVTPSFAPRPEARL